MGVIVNSTQFTELNDRANQYSPIADRVAVFFDYENLRLSMQTKFGNDAVPDVFKILKKFEYLHDSVAFAKVYMVTKSLESIDVILKLFNHAGISVAVKECNPESSSAYSSKRNMDLQMATDIMSAHSRYDTIAIISGDSDFIYLVNALKSFGHRVEIGAVHKCTSRQLIDAADITVFLNEDCLQNRGNNEQRSEED